MNKVLASNKRVASLVNSITINADKVRSFAETLQGGAKTSEIDLFGAEWEFEEAFTIVLIFNAMNFCYWAEKGKSKWQVEISDEVLDGSIALFRLLERLAIQDPDFLSMQNISSISLSKFQKMMKGLDKPIPMIEERYSNLVLLAREIISNYGGDPLNILKESQNCAVRLTNRLVELRSYEDVSTFKDNEVFFWKRAQLQTKMTNDILMKYNSKPLRNMHTLTAFADYKVPQLLRHLGVLEYDIELAHKVDYYELIEPDSDLENEIRVASILAVEEIRKMAEEKGVSITASEIDSILWNRAAANTDDMSPYHRTYTSAY